MKIQVIVVGWHYTDYPGESNLIDGLIEFKNENEFVDVFYSCHREPPKEVKENFDWKLFPNLGMADGGFQQAIDFLDIEDDTICLFFQDDVIIKNWECVNICLELLDSNYKFIGNCMNYPTSFNPFGIEKASGKQFADFTKDETKHLFDRELQIKTLRTSFFCTKYKYLKDIHGFEPIWVEPIQDKDGNWHTEGHKGIGGIGNLIIILFAYKINRVYGSNAITYLSNRYLDSDFMYECARGQIDENNPPTE
jgi:hypothetical protein|tara:strand:- start:2882 stop:3634 length:753 start_codon:yes stop_codon:yes gene_type:complete